MVAFKSTLAHDIKAREISPEDMGLFNQSQTNKSLLGRRGVPTMGKLTTPSGTFADIPTIEGRQSLRVTARNLERFRSPEVAATEQRLQGLFGEFNNARESAVMRLRSLNPQLFRSRKDIFAEQYKAQQEQRLDRKFASSRTDQILDSNSSVRGARIQELTGVVEGEIDKDINRFHRQAIGQRQEERGRLLSERDRAARTGETDLTPKTVTFGRGGTTVIPSMGERIIPQGLTQSALNSAFNKAQSRGLTSIQPSDHAANTRAIDAARQRKKTVRDSTPDV